MLKPLPSPVLCHIAAGGNVKETGIVVTGNPTDKIKIVVSSGSGARIAHCYIRDTLSLRILDNREITENYSCTGHEKSSQNLEHTHSISHQYDLYGRSRVLAIATQKTHENS